MVTVLHMLKKEECLVSMLLELEGSSQVSHGSVEFCLCTEVHSYLNITVCNCMIAEYMFICLAYKQI